MLDRNKDGEEDTTEGGAARCVAEWMRFIDTQVHPTSFAFFLGLTLAKEHPEYALALCGSYQERLLTVSESLHGLNSVSMISEGLQAEVDRLPIEVRQ